MLGVYFSGNDHVYSWVVAFLESYREFNPDLPLRLIPFNDHCERVFALADRYRFEIHTDSTFNDLEGIGRELELGITPTGPNWFRRFCSFWGPFEAFFYLDARTLVLTDLRPILEKLVDSRFDLFHYDCALDQVYNPGNFREGLLERGGARGFNSGRWAAKQGLFAINELVEYGKECCLIRNELNPRNTDQFFLNYCCDSKGLRIANFADVMGGMCSSGWGRQSGQVFRDKDRYRRWDHGGTDHKKIVPLLHWAGIPLSYTMPESNLFFQYRDRSLTPLQQKINRVSRFIVSPCMRFIGDCRRNRLVNQLWHKIKGKAN